MATFVERKTEHPFRHGLLHVYDTNTPCRDLKFEFDSFMISMMVAGHKTVKSENVKVEFFPNFIYIPEKDQVHSVDIPNATLNNPTKCYLLSVNPNYLEELYFELIERNISYKADLDLELTHFISNDRNIIEAFQRLGHQLEIYKGKLEDDIYECMLREILIRLYQTDARNLLIQNFQDSKEDKTIEKALTYIKLNLANNISIDNLTEVSRLGKTTFFKRFNESMSMSPVTYIMKSRIEHSKKLLLKEDSLQSVAYECGFNTYEHFYKSFKRMENMTPKEYRKRIGVQPASV